MTDYELARAVVETAAAKGLWLTTAESLTGGMICERLVCVPGASRAIAGGICSYDPRIKRDVLGVSQQIIDAAGVVSEACAAAMAKGARALMKVDIAVSSTGVAGPGGGTAETPVGTVFIGIATKNGAYATEHRFTGDRQAVREQAARAAIQALLSAMS